MKPQNEHTLPEGWEWKRLGEIGKISSGTTPSRSQQDKYFNNGTTAWVKTTDLNNSVISQTEEKVTNEALRDTSLRIYPNGTILVAMYGGFNQIGRTGLLGIPATINQALSAVSLLPEMKPEFVLNWLNLNVEEWKRFAGSSRKDPNITGKDVADFPIPIPPLPEQRQIAAVLGTWDRAIEQSTQLLKVLRQRHQGLAQRLLTGQMRLPGFEGEWKEVKLGELFNERNQTGYINLPLLSITAEQGVIYRTELDKRDTSNEDKSKYKRICPGDIGYNTMRMWQGRSAISSLEGIVSPAYTIVIPKGNTNIQFMGHLFKLPQMIHRFYRNSQGLVDDTLNCKFPEFSKVVVLVAPTIEEQCAIAQVLDTSLREIRQQEAKLEAVREQKRGLMQNLLTGRVRVPLPAETA